MSVRWLLQASACLALLTTGSVASAGGWHNGITRKLGIWYSDGYHAHEGCPTERMVGRGSPGHPHYADGYGDPGYRPHASPFADQHRPYSHTPFNGSIPRGTEYSEVLDEPPIDAQPTPAKPRTTNMPAAPIDPSVPTREGHSEARLPSSMFPLMPIR